MSEPQNGMSLFLNGLKDKGVQTSLKEWNESTVNMKKASKQKAFVNLNSAVLSMLQLAKEGVAIDVAVAPLRLWLAEMKVASNDGSMDIYQSLLTAMKSEAAKDSAKAAGEMFNYLASEQIVPSIREITTLVSTLNSVELGPVVGYVKNLLDNFFILDETLKGVNSTILRANELSTEFKTGGLKGAMDLLHARTNEWFNLVQSHSDRLYSETQKLNILASTYTADMRPRS